MTLADFLLARYAAERQGTATQITQHRDAAAYLARVMTFCHVGQQVVSAYMAEAAVGSQGERDGLYRAMQHLGLAYADDPDYQQEWRP